MASKKELETLVADLQRQLDAVKAGGPPPVEAGTETVWTGLNPTDADIIREAKRGRHMVTPPEAKAIEEANSLRPQGAKREEVRTTFVEDEKGRLHVSRESLASASAPIPSDPHKGGRNIDNLGEVAKVIEDEQEDIT